MKPYQPANPATQPTRKAYLLALCCLSFSALTSGATSSNRSNISSSSSDCHAIHTTLLVGHGASSSSVPHHRMQEALEETYHELATTTTSSSSSTSSSACPPKLHHVKPVDLPNQQLQPNNNSQHHHQQHPRHKQSQPLPPWYQYDQMLAWEITAQVGSDGVKSALFALDHDSVDDDTRSMSLGAMNAAYSQRLVSLTDADNSNNHNNNNNNNHKRHLEEVNDMLEVAAFECNNDQNSDNDFTASILVELALAPNGEADSPSSSTQLYEQIQLWKQAIEMTYNSLQFYTCDAPHFRTIAGVQVEELVNADPTRTSRLLRFSVAVECRDCEGETSIFATTPAASTNVTELLPVGWRSPSLQDLKGPRMRQNEEGQCYCAASHALDASSSTGPPTREQFLLALNTTLLGLYEEGFLQDYGHVQSVIQLEEEEDDQEETCADEIVSVETQVLLQLDQPLLSQLTAAKSFSNNSSATVIITAEDIASALRVVYNQWSLYLCDQPFHRRIVNVTLRDYPGPLDTRLPLLIQAECHGCTAEDVQGQAWLFHEGLNVTDEFNSTDVLVGLPESPVLTCDCPHRGDAMAPPNRAPTANEVMLALNARLNELVSSAFTSEDDEVNTTATATNATEQAETREDPSPLIIWVQQVQDYECQVDSESKKTFTNVLVNFTGDPQLLTRKEIAALEVSFANTYNSFAFEQCDGKFRQISDIRLYILPKKLLTGEVGSSRLLENEGGEDIDWYTNSTTNATLFFGNETNATMAPANATPPDLEDFVSTTDSTSVFRVGVECRRCPADDTESFGLFDSFERRLRQRQVQKVSDATIGFDAYMAGPLQSDTNFDSYCYCPAGLAPDDGVKISQVTFLRVFQHSVEALAEKDEVKGIQAVEVVEEAPDFCFNDLMEAETTVVLDFEEYDDYRNMSLYTNQQVQDSFRLAANSARESDCAPLVQDTTKVDIVSSNPADVGPTTSRAGGSMFGNPSVTLELKVDVLESTSEPFSGFLTRNSAEVQNNMWAILRKVDAGKGTALDTPAPTAQPTTPRPTAAPLDQPAPQPTPDPTTEPTGRPSDVPSSQPSVAPTDQPTPKPTPDVLSSLPSAAPTKPPTPQPTPDPTVRPSDVPSSQPSAAPTNQPTHQPTPEPTSEPTGRPSDVPSTGSPSAAPSATLSSGPSAAPSHPPSTPTELGETAAPTTTQPSRSPSSPPVPVPSPKPTLEPTGGPSADPSEAPSKTPSAAQSPSPSSAPSDEPSKTPSQSPSASPWASPSNSPTVTVSDTPTHSPSSAPTKSLTGVPSTAPSQAPTTGRPTTASPTSYPLVALSEVPSQAPTIGSPTTESHSSSPSMALSEVPSQAPTTGSPTTESPSSFPLVALSEVPSLVPTTGSPTTGAPSSLPSKALSEVPTQAPTTGNPTTESPSSSPSEASSDLPSQVPSTDSPSSSPSKSPSEVPSQAPTTGSPTTESPSVGPSKAPSGVPSQPPTTESPSVLPSKAPSEVPSPAPTTGSPTAESPSLLPSKAPSEVPSEDPTTLSPSISPSKAPSQTPSEVPSQDPTTESPTTLSPSSSPSKAPSQTPSEVPSQSPTGRLLNPTRAEVVTERPSAVPSSTPSETPSASPSESPSESRTGSPTTQPTPSPTVKVYTVNVLRFQLINTIDGSVLNETVNDGDILKLSSYPVTKLSLRAITDVPAEGVIFFINDVAIRTEYYQPYSLASNEGILLTSPYYPAAVLSTPTDALKIQAYPYDAGGEHGKSAIITIKIEA